MSLRIVFMGTPDFAVPILEAIAKAGHRLIAVYTRAPAQAGRRGLQTQPSPVHQAADRFAIPVFMPASLRGPEAAAQFDAHAADLAIVVAYGLILPKSILDLPRFGCLNLHASLLPRWRGAAPIQRAIMAGDRETGIGVMKMEEGLDTGPVGLEARIEIPEGITAGALHDRLMGLGAELMVKALEALETGSLHFRAQPETGVTYAQKIDKAEARIDFSRPAHAVLNQIHGLSPHPGAFFEWGPPAAPRRVKLLRAMAAPGRGEAGEVIDAALTIACGEGAIRPLEVQPAGKSKMPVADFLRGAAIAPGTRLL